MIFAATINRSVIIEIVDKKKFEDSLRIFRETINPDATEKDLLSKTAYHVMVLGGGKSTESICGVKIRHEDIGRVEIEEIKQPRYEARVTFEVDIPTLNSVNGEGSIEEQIETELGWLAQSGLTKRSLSIEKRDI